MKVRRDGVWIDRARSGGVDVVIGGDLAGVIGCDELRAATRGQFARVGCEDVRFQSGVVVGNKLAILVDAVIDIVGINQQLRVVEVGMPCGNLPLLRWVLDERDCLEWILRLTDSE